MQTQNIIELIHLFNESKNIKTYDIICKLFDDVHKCMYCKNHILYKNTKIKYTSIKKNINITGNSYKTIKTIDGVNYKLVCCEECLFKKFEYLKNKTRFGFNTFGNTVEYAFNIDSSILKIKNKSTAITLENLQKKYGIEEGEKRFKQYCDRQAYSNSYEYKNKKYNWSSDHWNIFNKSRSVTLENLQKKYGIEEGEKRFKEYCDRQAYTESIEYFKEKYKGNDLENDWKLQCNKKGSTLDNFQKKYGEIEGFYRYNEVWTKNRSPFSKKSQLFFDELDLLLSEYNFKTYYATKNQEYGKWLHKTNTYNKVDYFISDLNLIIEYYGDIFHGNPKTYKSNDMPNPYRKDLTAKDIWTKDKIRIDAFKEQYNFETIIVWEDNDYLKDRKTPVDIYKLIKENYLTKK